MPALEKTWTKYQVALPATGTAASDLTAFCVALAAMYVTCGWVVRGSSTGVVGAMDGVNRWLTGTALVANGTTGTAWLALGNNTMNAELLIRLDQVGNSPLKLGFFTAREPFTYGGSPGARPTAVGEFQHKTGYARVLYSAPSKYWLVGLKTSDNRNTRILVVSDLTKELVHSQLWEDIKNQAAPDPGIVDPGIEWASAIYLPLETQVAGYSTSFYDFLVDATVNEPNWVTVGDWTVPWDGTEVPWDPAVAVSLVRVVDARTVDVVFNRGVDPVSASNPANYVFTPTLTVVSATMVSDFYYRIVTSRQSTGVSYSLAISNILPLD